MEGYKIKGVMSRLQVSDIKPDTPLRGDRGTYQDYWGTMGKLGLGPWDSAATEQSAATAILPLKSAAASSTAAARAARRVIDSRFISDGGQSARMDFVVSIVGSGIDHVAVDAPLVVAQPAAKRNWANAPR
jgi:hypothetical protein